MSTNPAVPRLLPMNEVANVLGVSVHSIRRLVTAGELRSVNVGARVLIPSGEVDRVVSEGVGTPRSRKVRVRG